MTHPLDFGSRSKRLQSALADAEITALLVTRLPNIRYLTGFSGSAALLLVTDERLTFVTDGRYGDQATEQLRAAAVDARIEIRPTQAGQRDAVAAAATGVARVGLEAHGVTWAQQRAYAESWFPTAELVPTENLVEDLRMVKEHGEVARIRAACALGDEALAEVIPLLTHRPTERAVALALEIAMRERGASGVSFDPIVAAGPNGAKPHHRPSDRRIEPGELVVLDFGCVVDGYCSDMTRTVSVGDPGPEARRVYEVVAEAQAAGRASVRADASCVGVDRACRAVIETAGWGDAFSHGTGHGVGLEIHEAPRVAPSARGTLSAGQVVTVEPGVYLTGVGGVRIEDTVVVTPEGAEILTTSPKELVPPELAPKEC